MIEHAVIGCLRMQWLTPRLCKATCRQYAPSSSSRTRSRSPQQQRRDRSAAGELHGTPLLHRERAPDQGQLHDQFPGLHDAGVRETPVQGLEDPALVAEAAHRQRRRSCRTLNPWR